MQVPQGPVLEQVLPDKADDMVEPVAECVMGTTDGMDTAVEQVDGSTKQSDEGALAHVGLVISGQNPVEVCNGFDVLSVEKDDSGDLNLNNIALGAHPIRGND
ncbi:unnamed protein product [Amaranthus hypochondriacus]